MNKFIIRTLTSIVFVIVLVGSILWSPVSFAVLFAAITGLSAWEFCTIVNQNAQVQANRFISTVAAVYLYMAVYGFNLNLCGSEVFIPYIVSIIYLLVSELYRNHPQAISNWAFALMSQLYVAMPLASANTLAFVSLPQSGDVVYTPFFVLAVFIFLWCNDAGAYCVGSLLGRHKLFPRISPAKTWEGSIGGGLLAVIAAVIMDHLPIFATAPYATLPFWIGLALTVVVFGTWGDLVESLLKRQLHIKDSGHILPGHGGMLDRFDSSLIAFPAAVVYIYTISYYF